jgi:phosphopantothenoylcysteine decarboxylase/phosphopantothenate--cysteine ligase
MGFELARVAAGLGAKVLLVTGPSHLKVSHELIRVIRITSADEMFDSVHSEYQNMDIVICAAAVADYKPRSVAQHKIKKQNDNLSIELVRTKDILLSLGQQKKNQYLVGFALETENELKYAQEKLIRKNLDAIVLNSLNDEGAGFGTPTNKITFIDKNSDIIPFELKSKEAVAQDIFREILKRYHA